MTINVKLVDRALEPQAQKLLNIIHATTGQQWEMILHPRKTKSRPGNG